jgi:hypothetical protein
MPFKREYDCVFDMICRAGELANLRVRRVDQEPFTGSMISHIMASIQASDFLLGVISEENGNVYYEIGLAHCQKKPVVLLTSDYDSLKFDLRDHRTIRYDPENPESALEELVKTLTVLQHPPDDPRLQLADSIDNPEQARRQMEQRIERAKRTLVEELSLQEPIEIMRIFRPEGSADLAIEVKDFFGDCYRAIIDVNFIVRDARRVNL